MATSNTGVAGGPSERFFVLRCFLFPGKRMVDRTQDGQLKSFLIISVGQGSGIYSNVAGMRSALPNKLSAVVV